MLTKEELISFYKSQYEMEITRKRSKNLRIRDLEDRARRLRSSMKRINTSRMGMTALEELHRQVRNIAEYSIYRHKDKILAMTWNELIPDLVRLDMAALMPEQQEGLDDHFLLWMKRHKPGAICSRPLFYLYPAYKESVIREQMTELVPTRPEMEFPDALQMKRRFILHVGPTNSGKTFHALQRLKLAKHGIYLGPLRLLALEVYEKMQEYQVPATMLTGQEYFEDEGSRVTAATVEMADLDDYYDIAVIDEAQLMADPDRGHSWTRAILGLKASEIHVCCSPAAETVLTHLIELCRDTWEVSHYERKTKLLFEDKPFSFPEDIRDGDALIVFSKKNVLDAAGRLETAGISCSVIYGSLPPEIRRRQMHLFTDRKTRVVVSTDAIGMGLNLPVRRIVFLQTSKYDGTASRMLNTSEVRQIAGRAGRYGIYDTGYISAIDEESLEYLQEQYHRIEKPVSRVSLGFPQVLLDIKEPMDEILKVWHSQPPIEPFEKENVDEMLFLYERARAVRFQIDGFDDKRLLYRMISCPIDIKNRQVVALWLDYCMTWSSDVSLKKPALNPREKNSLMKYETYYKQLDLYYQMSYRLGKHMDEDWIRQERAKTEDRIMRYLLKDKANYIKRCRYCGRMLPLDYPFNCCSRCWQV